MASLQQIISWFKTGLFPNEDQFRQTWQSFWHKSERIPQTQIFGLQETLESATRGLIYQNPVDAVSDLATTYPNAQVGWAAMVRNAGYIYSFNGTAWANTGLTAFPANVATQDELAQLGLNLEQITTLDAQIIPFKSSGSGYWGGTEGKPVQVMSFAGFYYMNLLPYTEGSIKARNFFTSSTAGICAFVDSSGNYIGRQVGNSTDLIEFTPPAGCAFLGFFFDARQGQDISKATIEIRVNSIKKEAITILPAQIVGENNLDERLQETVGQVSNYVGVFTPNPTSPNTAPINVLRGNANIYIVNLTSVEFYATSGNIEMYILRKSGSEFIFHSKKIINVIDGLNVVNLNYGIGQWAVLFKQLDGQSKLYYSTGSNATGFYITQSITIPNDDDSQLVIPESFINGIASTSVNYNYLIRIRQDNYINDLAIFNEELFQNDYNLIRAQIVGSETASTTPGNPFGSIYVFNKEIHANIQGFSIRASQAGVIEIILLKISGENYNTVVLPYDCIAGNNYFPYVLDNFLGKIGVRCISGKFYFSQNDITSVLSSISIPTSSDTPTQLSVSSVNAGNLPNWNLSIVPDLFIKEFKNNIVARLSQVEEDIKNIKPEIVDSEILRKKLLAIGDSITAISQGDTYAQRIARWMDAEEYNNVAIGGATWAWRTGTTQTDNPGTDDTNVMSNQVLKVIKMFNDGVMTAPDLIFLSAAINDVARNHAIGNVATEYAKNLADVDMYSIIGSIRWCVQTLMQTFPDVRIFLLTPLHTSVAARTFEKMKSYRQAILDSGVRLSVPIIDCTAECLINEINESRYMQADKLHPNSAGQNMMARYVWNRLVNFYYDV